METSGTTWRLRSRWWGRTTTTTTITSITPSSTIMCNHSVLAWVAPDEWGELENSNCSFTWINYMKLSNFLNSNCFNITLNWSNCVGDKIDIDISHDWLIEKKQHQIFVFPTDFFFRKDLNIVSAGSAWLSPVSLSFMSSDYLSQHFMINWVKWWKKTWEEIWGAR